MWLLDSIDDIRSDMSVYHRVDEVEYMTAERFVSFAYRLPVYGGAVAVVAKRGIQTTRSSQDIPPVQERRMSDVVELMKADPLFMGQGTYVQVSSE